MSNLSTLWAWADPDRFVPVMASWTAQLDELEMAAAEEDADLEELEQWPGLDA